MFRDAFRRTRCLIPASGYYEWETTPDGKQPYYITPASGPVLTIAGLWSEWRDRVSDETLVTCTVIITEANSFIGAIHDRMPVLLDEEGAAAWLSGDAGLELLKLRLCRTTAARDGIDLIVFAAGGPTDYSRDFANMRDAGGSSCRRIASRTLP